MAHYTQHQFVQWIRDFFPSFFEGKRVLEVGSLDINGSVRDLFRNCDYTGLDLGPGPGVDIVCGGHEYDAPDSSFDVVCSFEAMEHNPHWKETFSNMIRLVKPGGLVVLTCATVGRPEHGTSRTTPQDSPLTLSIGWDYYRNLSRRDFSKAFRLQDEFNEHIILHYYYGCDLFFLAFRKGAASPSNVRAAMMALRIRYLARNLLNYEAIRMMIQVKIGRHK